MDKKGYKYRCEAKYYHSFSNQGSENNLSSDCVWIFESTISIAHDFAIVTDVFYDNILMNYLRVFFIHLWRIVGNICGIVMIGCCRGNDLRRLRQGVFWTEEEYVVQYGTNKLAQGPITKSWAFYSN